MSELFFFFFFQAEDGIRDLIVTGVQTCALPISSAPGMSTPCTGGWASSRRCRSCGRRTRSEERRVGKECRSRWSPDHSKKKEQVTLRRDLGDFAEITTGLTGQERI